MDDKKNINKSVMHIKKDMTDKYDSFKKEIIAALAELVEEGYSRFPNVLKIRVYECGREFKINFTGLKVMDGTVWFENTLKKVLYSCDTASVDELMRVLKEVEETLS